MIIILYDLPKISLNEWYAGSHWSRRTKIKDTYKLIIKSQCKEVFSKSNQYDCSYDFTFKNNPLDASNCIAMVKMIEDIIFESDGYKIVKSIKITSDKGLKDEVEINIFKL